MRPKDQTNWMLTDAIEALARAERLHQSFLNLHPRGEGSEPLRAHCRLRHRRYQWRRLRLRRAGLRRALGELWYRRHQGWQLRFRRSCDGGQCECTERCEGRCVQEARVHFVPPCLA